MALEFDVKGTLAREFGAIAGAIADAAAAALREEAEIEMTEAKERTPVDTGALRASGHVETPEVSPGEVSVTLAFGGPAIGYAIYVHENLEALHPVGQAKFLESVLIESAPHFADRVGTRMRRKLGL